MTDAKTCDLLAEKLAARHPDDLMPAERAQLDAHIASCPTCSAKHADYDLLATRIRHLPRVKPLAETTPAFFWRDTLSQPSRTNNTGTQQSRPLRALPYFSNRALGISAGVLLAASIMITSLLLLRQFTFGRVSETASTSQQNIVSSNVCPEPVNNTNISCAAQYTGTLADAIFKEPSPMQLSIRQKQETLSGSCTLFRPNVIRVPFSGTIDDRGVLQFSIHIDNPSNFTITFTGKVNKDMEIMSGTYMTSNGQRGTWIMHLA